MRPDGLTGLLFTDRHGDTASQTIRHDVVRCARVLRRDLEATVCRLPLHLGDPRGADLWVGHARRTSRVSKPIAAH